MLCNVMVPTIDGQGGGVITTNGKRRVCVPFYIQHQAPTNVRQDIGKFKVMRVVIYTVYLRS